jgi:hypothetical protein
MRAVYLFFVSLCFILVSGLTHAHLVAHGNKNISSIKLTAKYLKFTIRGEDHPLVRAATVSEEKQFLITDEDDDEHDLSASKYTLLAKYSLLFTFTFFLAYLYSCIKDRLPACAHLSHINSYKYISQRVLRI